MRSPPEKQKESISVHVRSFSRWLLAGAVLLSVALSACGSSSAGSKGTIVVASKHDGDSQIEGEMFLLLLQHHGYTVVNKINFGNSTEIFSAIQSGAIDLYPEFTGDGLHPLGLTISSDPQTVYNEVKAGYQSKYNLTWLDAAFNLNDDYGLCTSQAIASQYHLTKISDVTTLSSQFVLAAQSDAISDPTVVQALENTYSLHFKNVLSFAAGGESLTYPAVENGQAQLNICYTTDPNIVTQNFVLLQDDKNALPVYNPAPLIRTSVLNAHPDIANILNPLMAKLNTTNIVQAIKSLQIDHMPLETVAQNLLNQLGVS
jgi:osmoprotectant transport system substrate-binding protein